MQFGKDLLQKLHKRFKQKDLNTLRRELREGFMIMALQTMLSMEDSGNILGMLTGERQRMIRHTNDQF